VISEYLIAKFGRIERNGGESGYIPEILETLPPPVLILIPY